MSPNANFAFARALLDELARAGVQHVCVCPGSRSAPLAVEASRTRGLRCWTHLDERSAGFFALGIARASGAPAALICTSGTAAANFAPAVAEAFYGRVPLVVLTADRPPELRDWGAGQTIAQSRIFGAHARWFAEAPVPEASAPILRHARSLAARAVATAAGAPAGPVHLNLPFRDPLHPEPRETEALAAVAEGDPAAWAGRGGAPYTRAWNASAAPEPGLVAHLARLTAHERGAIVCGPMDAGPGFPEALLRLASRAGWPVFPDALANLRSGPHAKEAPLIASFDALLREGSEAGSWRPSCILRFGDTPTSKATRAWLDRHRDAHQVLVDPDGSWHDPDFRAAEVVRADPTGLARALADALEGGVPRSVDSDWLHRFLGAEERVQRAWEEQLAAEKTLYEPRLVREIAGLLPDGATLFVSNSMPVRDVDGFWPVGDDRVRVIGNRGANGIDGIVSTALGARAASDGPLVLLTGDLALLHDLGGLLAARRHGIPVTIVVVQNDGGGIFSFLPIAGWGEEVAFREQFIAPHGLDLQGAARLFDLGFERASTPAGVREALVAALSARRTTLVEVPIDREASVEHHRALWRIAAEGAA